MQKIEKALLLVANLSQDKKILDYRIEEILNLCDTSKVDIQGIVVQNIKKPLRSYLGSGKLKESLQEAKLLKERELAAGVQKSLFPDISKFENFIYARNIPARDVSGDYFDVVRSTPEEYFFTLADVSGKGVKAGMYMAKASSIFRTCLLYTSPSPRDS